jgi:hypothetical protein
MLECPGDCDCDDAEIGVDPCFSPGSCECFCMRLRNVQRVCPQLEVCE